MNAARWMRINPLKVVLLGVLLAVVLELLLLTLEAAQKPAEAAFPGHNGKIAFTMLDDDGNVDIYTLNPDGAGFTQVTDEAGLKLFPAWSPDGARIAYTMAFTDGDIYTVGADGGTPTLFAETTGHHPAWSPDGTKLAFSSPADGDSEIYTINTDGTGLVQLTHNTTEDGACSSSWNYSEGGLDWSPDGTRIAYTAFEGAGDSCLNGDSEIYTIPAGGGDPTRVTDDTVFKEREPDWSPDGTELAYEGRSDPDEPFEQTIYTVSLAGGAPTHLLAGYPAEVHGSPAWSPDGTKIVYEQGGISTDYEIHMVPADGGTPSFVKGDLNPSDIGTGFPPQPDWQPLPGPMVPTSKAECKQGGYEEFGFENQGLCVADTNRVANSE